MSSRRPTKDEHDQLIKAAEEGDITKLQHLIEKCQLDVDTRDPKRWNRTLLLISSEKGQLSAVKKLLQLGADINAVDQFGWNALHCAAYGGHEEIFTFLFNHHPDLLKGTSNDGANVLLLAARGGNMKVVNVILIQDPDLISTTNKHGHTALHHAACGGSTDVVDLLLSRHPDMITQTNNDGFTPLDDAVLFDESAVVWTLVHNHKTDITECKEYNREKAKELLAAEEARRAKSQAEQDPSPSDNNDSKQGHIDDTDDEDMKIAYSLALTDGEAYAKDLQILMVGAENTGKSCLISSFLDEIFIENQEATKGADTNICKIYCENWRRLSLSDMMVYLRHEFIGQFSTAAQSKLSESRKRKHMDSSSSSTGNTKHACMIMRQQLPEPHPQDIA